MSKILTDSIIPELKGKINNTITYTPQIVADSNIFQTVFLEQVLQVWGKIGIINFNFGLQSGKSLSAYSNYPLLKFPIKAKYFSQAPLTSQQPTGDNTVIVEIHDRSDTLNLRTFASSPSHYNNVWFRGQLVFIIE